MSIKHIEFLKVKPSKLLAVEVRPVRCVIETATGPTRTAKWMNYGHWKELRGLLNGVVSEYEDHKTSFKVTQDIECDRPATKNGTSIKIGYMFTKYRRCSCYYLTPREGEVWTDDEDDDASNLKLRDRGGRYRSLQPCGEMLVVSVSLVEGGGPKQQGVLGTSLDISLSDTPTRTASSSRSLDRRLIKTLNSTLPFTNTISDYFESSQSVGDQTDHTHKALKQVVSKSKKSKRKRKEPPSSPQKSSSENSNPHKRQDVQSSQSVAASTYYMNGDQSCNSLMENSDNSDNSSPVIPIIRSVSSSYRKAPSFRNIMKFSDVDGSQELNNASFSYPSSVISVESSFQWDSQAQSVTSQSPPPSPVLGMSRRSQTQECQSDTSFFLRQVDSTEEMREKEVSGCRNPPHEKIENYFDMELRLESNLEFSDSLPDLESEQLAESPSQSKSGQKNGAVFKDSETKSAERMKKKLQILFGESDVLENVTLNNFEENKCVSGSYVEEEYIPLDATPKRRIRSIDLFECSSVADSEPGHSELNNTEQDEINISTTSNDMASTNTSHILESKKRKHAIELKKMSAAYTMVKRGGKKKMYSESPTKQSIKSPEKMGKSKTVSHDKENGEKWDGKSIKKILSHKENGEKKDGKSIKKTLNIKENGEKKDRKFSQKTSSNKENGEKKDGEANNGQCVVQKLSSSENEKPPSRDNKKQSKRKSKACCDVSANQPKLTDWLTPKTSKYFSQGKNVKKDTDEASELDHDHETGKFFVGQDSSDEAFTDNCKISKKRKPKAKSKANTDESSSFEAKSPAKRAKRLSNLNVEESSSTCQTHSKKIKSCRKKPQVGGEFSVSSLVDSCNIEPLMIEPISKCSSPHLRVQRGSQEASNSDRSKDAAFEGLVRGFQKLQTMTQDDLQNRLDQDGPYLRRIIGGRETSERHQMFISGDRQLSMMGDELVYSPFSDDQIMVVHDYISERFSDIAKKIKNVFKFEDYIWKVLAPTFLIKVVMDNERVTQEEAEKIMVKFSLDRSITGYSSPPQF